MWTVVVNYHWETVIAVFDENVLETYEFAAAQGVIVSTGCTLIATLPVL